MDDLLEERAVDSIVKRVIAQVVDDVVRNSIGRIIQFDGRTRIPEAIEMLMVAEANRLITEDAEVKDALKSRLLKELAKTGRY